MQVRFLVRPALADGAVVPGLQPLTADTEGGNRDVPATLIPPNPTSAVGVSPGAARTGRPRNQGTPHNHRLAIQSRAVLTRHDLALLAHAGLPSFASLARRDD